MKPLLLYYLYWKDGLNQFKFQKSSLLTMIGGIAMSRWYIFFMAMSKVRIATEPKKNLVFCEKYATDSYYLYLSNGSPELEVASSGSKT